jgi:hypothetical protein
MKGFLKLKKTLAMTLIFAMIFSLVAVTGVSAESGG